MAIDILRSACPLDCPDACGLEVRVNDGRVTRLEGDRRNPLTQGYICSKVRHFPDHMYGAERLLNPGRRVGRKGAGEFERISWDEALDLAAAKIRQARERHGGESILPYSYGGSNGWLTQDTTDVRLFRRLGASRLARTVCAAPTGSAATGLYGKMPGVALQDFTHARLIVVWGANPSATGIHFVPIVQQAQKRGAKLVVIDPRRTPLAKKADLHLAPRPGGDLAIALALIRWLFANGAADLKFLAAHTIGWEELQERAQTWTIERAAEVAGVEASAIEEFARLYAESSPAAIRCGWGVERNRNGGSAVAAILALPAIGGKFGVRGGGYLMSNSAAWKAGGGGAAEPEARTGAPRLINMNLLGETLLSARPPVEVLFVYNSNAVVTSPNRNRIEAGLAREDLFTIVFDQVLTDTARWADLVLPATTFLEHHELARSYGAFIMHEIAPVVAAVGEARPNYEVFADLCRRLDLERPGDPTTPAELKDALLAGGREPARLRRELDSEGTALPDCGSAPVQFADSFPLTPDRKAHLVPPALDREAPHGLYGYRPAEERYSLTLISPATNRTISSSLGQLRRGLVAVELSPADAQARGIREGETVRIWNDLGEVVTLARVSGDLRPGVACLPKGLWSHNTKNGATANSLAPDSLTDLGAGACWNDARVEIERA